MSSGPGLEAMNSRLRPRHASKQQQQQQQQQTSATPPTTRASSKRRSSAPPEARGKKKGRAKAAATHEDGVGIFPVSVWRMIAAFCEQDAVIQLSASCLQLQSVCASCRVALHATLSSTSSSSKGPLPTPGRLSRRMRATEVTLTVQPGTACGTTSEVLGYYLSQTSVRSLKLTAPQKHLELAASLLQASQLLLFTPVVDSLELCKEGAGSMSTVAAILSGTASAAALHPLPPFQMSPLQLRRLDIAVSNEDVASISLLSGLEELVLRFQSYQNPSMSLLERLHNLYSFKFIQEDPRARIQLDAFSFLKSIGTKRLRKGEQMDVHLEVVLARQDSTLTFLHKAAIDQLSLVLSVPDDAAGTVSHVYRELHKLWLHKLEDDGNDDDSSEDEDDDPGIQVVRLPNIKLTVKCNSLRSRARTVTWPPISNEGTRRSQLYLDEEWNVEDAWEESWPDASFEVLLTGNTCPLRGLPVGLQDTAVTTLTISNCTLEDVDLQNLGLIQQLESLRLSADFSRCAQPMQDCAHELWSAVGALPALRFLEVTCEPAARLPASTIRHPTSAVASTSGPSKCPSAVARARRPAAQGLLELRPIDLHFMLCCFFQLASLRICGFSAGKETTDMLLQMKAAALVAPDKYAGKAVWALLRLADWDQACSNGAPFVPARHLPAEFPASWVRNFDVAVHTGRVVSGGGCHKYQPLLSETQAAVASLPDLKLPADAVVLHALLNEGGILSLPEIAELPGTHCLFSPMARHKPPQEQAAQCTAATRAPSDAAGAALALTPPAAAATAVLATAATVTNLQSTQQPSAALERIAHQCHLTRGKAAMQLAKEQQAKESAVVPDAVAPSRHGSQAVRHQPLQGVATRRGRRPSDAARCGPEPAVGPAQGPAQATQGKQQRQQPPQGAKASQTASQKQGLAASVLKAKGTKKSGGRQKQGRVIGTRRRASCPM